MPSEHKFPVKPFPVDKQIQGISVRTNQEHYKLYQGYVNRWNEILEKLKTADRSKANATYSEFSELKRQETFNANGKILHELFFPTILGGDGKPKGEILEKIKQDFGSFEAWKEDFIATGMSARGWAILALELQSEKLFNFLVDLQNVGHVQDTVAILALDVFEHAYFIDYGTNRKSYIDAFFNNINWDFVEKRYQYAKKVAQIYKEYFKE
ncbi:MAG TPA: superoxide dismutase [Geobacterales bacterium]|nr:superoxide dismutase [Geobacterales bacterium]